MSLLSRSLLLLCAGLFVAGCGSVDDDQEGGSGAATDAFSLPDGLFSEAGSSGVVDSAASDTKPGEVCEFPANPAPGEPGASCDKPTDCDSGYCIHTADGKVCTRTCVECCPTGFACEQLETTDTVFLCIAKHQAVCRPCKTDAECGELSKGALCVDYGPDGRFCGGECTEDSDCPDGYSCAASDGEKGASKQCVKADKVCACSPRSIADGAETACAVTNAEGSCLGTRKCTVDGLTACDAPAPVTEVCDGADNDCDGHIDESCDLDGDGFCALSANVVGLPAACSKGKGDCDDTDAAISPDAKEACNALDDDCDNQTDEADATGCSPYFLDADKDTYGTGAATCQCAPTGLFTAATGTDCKDDDGLVHPAATETCNGKDDDCDGLTDEPGAGGCTQHFVDADKDGYGGGKSACLCGKSDQYPSIKSGDCDDGSAAANPEATESCNSVDDDCDGATDEADATGCTPHYVDADKDGFGDATQAACLCNPVTPHAAVIAGDCDDKNKAVHPQSAEVCNTIDDDCDSQTDEADAKGCTSHFPDSDGDGFGADDGKKCLCSPSKEHPVTKAKDCNDKNKAIHPDAKETCNSVDDDCDAATDELNAIGCKPHFKDGDGDGYGQVDDVVCTCAPQVPYTAIKPGDCNDKAKPVNPDAAETCDGIDNDCDGGTDEQGAKGCIQYYLDHDGDKLGDGAVAPRCLCAPKAPYAAPKAGDCNDNDKEIWLNAPESCDKKDNDCDGVTDEPGAKDCKDFYFDGDGDGWGLKSAKQCACQPIGPYKALKQHDCADNDKSINPSEAEQCDNKDNDCNGKTDDNVGNTSFYEDKDGDGWGVGPAKKMCKPSGTFKATKSGDCDDNDSVRFPNNPEVCDGKDNNCNNQVDEGGVAKVKYFRDSDQDGYGVSSDSKLLCLSQPPYTATKGGDCADNDKTVNPGAAEIHCNKKDDDCKGGDTCNQCGTSKCGGKCGTSGKAGVEFKQTCVTILGVTICNPPVAFDCYCDANCVALGDCCLGYATCCK